MSRTIEKINRRHYRLEMHSAAISTSKNSIYDMGNDQIPIAYSQKVHINYLYFLSLRGLLGRDTTHTNLDSTFIHCADFAFDPEEDSRLTSFLH